MTFSASEAGFDAFGWNVPLTELTPMMHARAMALGVTFIDDKTETSELSDDAIILKTQSGKTYSAKIAIAADGGNSPLRKSRGIETEKWSYKQSALVTSFSHTGPHGSMSTEYHKRAGAFTTVPLPGNRSSLVWMDRPERAEALFAMNDHDLAVEDVAVTEASVAKGDVARCGGWLGGYLLCAQVVRYARLHGHHTT